LGPRPTGLRRKHHAHEQDNNRYDPRCRGQRDGVAYRKATHFKSFGAGFSTGAGCSGDKSGTALKSEEVIEYWSSSENVQYWSSICTVVGLPIAVAAFIFAARQLSLAQRSGSAAALVAVHEAVRKAWADYVNSAPEKKEYAAGELCNALEVACAALADAVFFGESRQLLEMYLLHSLKLIERDDFTRELMLGFLQDPQTFKNIRNVLRRHRNTFRTLGAKPVE
jgi:hypothetical protein